VRSAGDRIGDPSLVGDGGRPTIQIVARVSRATSRGSERFFTEALAGACDAVDESDRDDRARPYALARDSNHLGGQRRPAVYLGIELDLEAF
jgi:hypothetical protein